MKKHISGWRKANWIFLLLVTPLLFPALAVNAQCVAVGNTVIGTYPNTYFPATTGSLPVGSMSLTIGAAGYGGTPISVGEVVMIIQMQGAQISNNNDNTYGSGSGSGNGSGYTNTNLYAGNFEFATAANNVALTGGTLLLMTATVNAYQNSAYGTNGQYTYQVIRIPTYTDVTLLNNIKAPRWNGSTGGVIMLYAKNNIYMNNKTIDASGLGFRGGAGRAGSGGKASYKYTDYVTVANVGAGANGSKGEGLAGTPEYSNNSYASIDTTAGAVEGYPGGSYAQGAPGNAGGGGTDGSPGVDNAQNTGGGGGGNGGAGGNGGNSWSSNLASGGRPGAVFTQAGTKRLVMGGGGGAGTTNDGTGTPFGGMASGGAAGGGIIILYALNTIAGAGSVLANGANGNATIVNDGAGGGGAGGSILLYSYNGSTTNLVASATGGNGGSNETGGGPLHGPGGGGGGGIIYSNSALKATSSISAGIAGTTNKTNNYGASNGSDGSMVNTITVANIAPVPSCFTLAVNFLDIKAQAVNGAVTVQWNTAYEVFTTGYSIERSTDGANFSGVGYQPFKATNDATNNAYQFTDNGAEAIGGTLYYRVREISSDGNTLYSRIVSVNLGTQPGKVTLYPNPARNSATLSFSSTNGGTIGMRLVDLRGMAVWTQQYQATPGVNTVQIDRLQTLPDGEYILQWFDRLNAQQVKLLVRH